MRKYNAFDSVILLSASLAGLIGSALSLIDIARGTHQFVIGLPILAAAYCTFTFYKVRNRK